MCATFSLVSAAANYFSFCSSFLLAQIPLKPFDSKDELFVARAESWFPPPSSPIKN
jgi:hypothetical protein